MVNPVMGGAVGVAEYAKPRRLRLVEALALARRVDRELLRFFTRVQVVGEVRLEMAAVGRLSFVCEVPRVLGKDGAWLEPLVTAIEGTGLFVRTGGGKRTLEFEWVGEGDGRRETGDAEAERTGTVSLPHPTLPLGSGGGWLERFPVELHVCERSDFGLKVMWFTGPGEWNRWLAKKRPWGGTPAGMHLEKGRLWREGKVGAEAVRVETEMAVFREMGIPWVAPEDRAGFVYRFERGMSKR